jgi:amino acid transporter
MSKLIGADASTRVGTGALVAVGCGTAIAAVCCIGVFQIEHLLGGVWSVLAVVVAGVGCGFLSRILGRLCSVVPSGAGLLAYFSRGFGRARGLAIAGPYLLLCLLLIGVEAVIVGVLVARVVPVPPIASGLVFIVGTWAMCRAGLRIGYRAQAISTWALVACLSALATLALARSGIRGELVARLFPAPPSMGQLASATGQALFLFMGFELLTSQVEVASSPRAVRSALAASVVVLTGFYALVSLGFSCLDHAPVGSAARLIPQIAIAEQTGSRAAVYAVIALSLLASFTSVNGALLALSRFVYALAAQNVLPRRLGRIEPRSLVPRNALAALLVLSVAALLLATRSGMLEPAICAAAITASFVYAALAWVRERSPFREAAGRSRWQGVASHALAVAFAGVGAAVLVEAGPARAGTLALLAVASCLVLVMSQLRPGATRHA